MRITLQDHISKFVNKAHSIIVLFNNGHSKYSSCIHIREKSYTLPPPFPRISMAWTVHQIKHLPIGSIGRQIYLSRQRIFIFEPLKHLRLLTICYEKNRFGRWQTSKISDQ